MIHLEILITTGTDRLREADSDKAREVGRSFGGLAEARVVGMEMMVRKQNVNDVLY